MLENKVIVREAAITNILWLDGVQTMERLLTILDEPKDYSNYGIAIFHSYFLFTHLQSSYKSFT